MKRIGTAAIILCASLTARAVTNKTQANSYDDGWQSDWVAHCTEVCAGGSGKTDGFVLQIGDSITHANPYSQWPRAGSGVKTAEDIAVCTWAHSTDWDFGSDTNTSIKNGWYLAAADTTGGRGMTAAGMIDTNNFLTGAGNGGSSMTGTTNHTQALTYIVDTSATGNIHIDTLIAAFDDARFAVMMLGTNDITDGRSRVYFINMLGTIIDKLEAQNIVVFLSTLSPYHNPHLKPTQDED